MADIGESRSEEYKVNTEDKRKKKIVEWTEEHENILAEWCDKAMCYRWMHSKAYQAYTVSNMWFTIPVIVMSTLTGTANFAQDKVPEDVKGWYSMGVGAVNIFAGILTTIAQFLKISELQEGHRVASQSWDKFYRTIKVELAKKPDERMDVSLLLRKCTDEYDRLAEISPTIDDVIIKAFQETFSDGVYKIKGSIDKDQLSDKAKAYLDLVKPEICASMTTCKENIYKAPDVDIKKMMDAARRLSMVNMAVQDNSDSQFKNKVIEIGRKLKAKLSRDPTPHEVSNELEEQSRADDEMKKYTQIALSKLQQADENNDGSISENEVINMKIGSEDNV